MAANVVINITKKTMAFLNFFIFVSIFKHNIYKYIYI